MCQSPRLWLASLRRRLATPSNSSHLCLPSAAGRELPPHFRGGLIQGSPRNHQCRFAQPPSLNPLDQPSVPPDRLVQFLVLTLLDKVRHVDLQIKIRRHDQPAFASDSLDQQGDRAQA